MMLIVILFIFFIPSSFTFPSQSPQWTTSNYFRTGHGTVINTLTGNQKTPNFTFTFTTPLTTTPHLAYGIQKYQGADYLIQQFFEIYRIELSTILFELAVQVTGSTGMYILTVGYLAVDSSFPYHFNAFDNVPVNYSSGNLINITKKSKQQSTYINTINYTQQSSNRKYTTFNTSSNYNIALFMTCLFVQTTKGNNGTNSTHNTSVDLRMSYVIINESFYRLKVRLKQNVRITQLKFSEIIVDVMNVQQSKLYDVVFEQWQVGQSGGMREIQNQFEGNFIMGLTEFTTVDGDCGIDYQWDWLQNDTFAGVIIHQSVMRNSACSFNRSLSTILYIKTLKCPSPYYYYNSTTGLCQNQCGLYFYGVNSQLAMTNNYQTQHYCAPCQWGCSQCSQNNSCVGCNSDDMRLFNGSCYCPHGYLDTRVVTRCQPCADVNCLVCEKNPNYNPNNPTSNTPLNLCVLCSSAYYLNQTQKTCSPQPTCNSSLNQLINYQTNACQPCPLLGCLECKQTLQLRFNNTVMNIMQVGTKRRSLIATSVYGVVTCESCDQSNGYFMNLTTLACQLCQINYCLICTSLYTCSLCDQNQQYYLNNKTKQCEYCQVEGCLECINLTTCRKCDNLRGYFLSPSTQTCQNCGIGCLQCQLSTSNNNSSTYGPYCTKCAPNLSLTQGKCHCPLISNYLTIMAADEDNPMCNACDPRCKRCANTSSQCVECYFQQNRILATNNNTCACNSTNYIEPILEGQHICTKVNTSLCDMGYYHKITNYSTFQCAQICGDGVRIQLQCDDGNTIDRDGCSSTCQIQTDFHCTTDPYQLSVCNYFGEITVIDYNITKQAYDNVFKMEMKLQPQLVLYQWIVWRERLVFEGSAKIDLVAAGMEGADVLEVKGRYYQNIQHIDITLKFLNSTTTPTSSLFSPTQRLLQVSPSQQSLNMNITFTFTRIPIDFSKTTNNLQLQYYPQSVYDIAQQFSSAFHVMSIVYLAIVLPTLFIMKRMSPVLVVIVAMQLCYVSLTAVGSLQPVTFALVNNFYYVFGLNNLSVMHKYCYQRQSQQDVDNNSVFGAANFSSCFVKNVNLMIVFELGAIVGMMVTALLGIRFKSARQWFNNCKRALSNMVFFNLSHTVISLSLIDWPHVHILQILTFLLQLLLTIYHIYLILNPKRNYFIQIEIEDFLLARDIKLKHEQNKRILENIKEDRVRNKRREEQVRVRKGNNESSEVIVERNGQNGANNDNDRKQQMEGWQEQGRNDFNKQAIYFACFTICLTCISPPCYLLLNHSPLILNLITACLLTALITIHLITNPFHQNPNSFYEPFSKIPLNYFFVYTLCSLYVGSNLACYVIERVYGDGDQLEKKMNGETIVAYVQVGMFLMMLVYALVVWWYTVYLSFFQDEVIETQQKPTTNNIEQQKQQTTLPVQQPKPSHLQKNKPTTSTQKPQLQLFLPQTTQRRRLSKRKRPKPQSNTQQMKVIDLSSVKDNIIFQIDNDDETYPVDEEVKNNNKA